MKRIGWAEIGSAVAVVVSSFALFVSFYQARIAERQAHASVWPYLSIDYDINDQGQRIGFIWTVENNGLGPALIQSVIVSVDDKPQRNWDEVSKALGITKSFSSTMSEVSGRVLPPDTNRETTIDAIHVISAPEAKLLRGTQAAGHGDLLLQRLRGVLGRALRQAESRQGRTLRHDRHPPVHAMTSPRKWAPAS
jgi:hypothetical protein